MLAFDYPSIVLLQLLSRWHRCEWFRKPKDMEKSNINRQLALLFDFSYLKFEIDCAQLGRLPLQ